eukprot:14954977-Alexandrium_andersonii.AAC.1
MSASLVGSEMCIRDREESAPGPAGQSRQTHYHGPRGTACCIRRNRPPSPVSYTHLTLPTICSV